MSGVKCVLFFDERTGTVTVETRKGERVLMLKVPAGDTTMKRALKAVNEGNGEDCDNFWMLVKPSDETVMAGLFSKKEVKVLKFEFEMK